MGKSEVPSGACRKREFEGREDLGAAGWIEPVLRKFLLFWRAKEKTADILYDWELWTALFCNVSDVG